MNSTGGMRARGHVISGAFVFLLLGVFAVFSTLMVLMSAQLYRVTVDQTRAHNEERVLSSYLLNTVRGGDARGTLEVFSVDGVNVLALGYDAGAQRYQTQIYCWDGYLRERFADAAEPFAPDYGEKICAADGFAAKLRGGMLEMRVADGQGREQILHVALNCDARGEGALR